MKFFGWGRKKDPPPIQPAALPDSKNSDATRSTLESGALVGQARRLREEGVYPLGSATWEERLQETIRFVFSHQQEGLLAIGTFAIDQLADLHPENKPPAPTVSTKVNSQVNAPKVNSHCNHSVSSLQMAIPELEPQRLPSPIPPYPVFSASTSEPPISLILKAGTKPRSEISSHLDPVELHSPGLCGLLASRSRRQQREDRKKPPEHREKPPETREGTSHGSILKRITGSRRSLLWRGSSQVSPEKMLNPSTDRKPSRAQVITTKGPPCIANVVKEEAGSGGPMPSEPLEGGDQRQRRGHSFGWACAQNGKWIRTDSEFVVLEM